MTDFLGYQMVFCRCGHDKISHKRNGDGPCRECRNMWNSKEEVMAFDKRALTRNPNFVGEPKWCTAYVPAVPVVKDSTTPWTMLLIVLIAAAMLLCSGLVYLVLHWMK